MTDHKPTLVFLGTYPPRECGIATFTKDLLTASQKLLGTRVACRVAAWNISALDTYEYPAEVAWEINQHNAGQYRDLAHQLNSDPDVIGVIIQHEYGIFGGEDGENILEFMKLVSKPQIVTLHTLLPHPGEHLKLVTQQIISLSAHVVVLTQSSRDMLVALYPQAQEKVSVILHGIHPTPFTLTKSAKKKLKLNGHLVLSTFGLLSRGKGIEYVLQALHPVIKKYPNLQYLVLGETHPVVRRLEGEQYRNELTELVTRLNLTSHVKFYDQYLNLADLLAYLKATDVYICASVNPNQAVSGTLSYALGTGRAVISTDFPQASEVITQRIGRLVPVRNSPALTWAILDLLKRPVQLEQMHQHAYAITRPMLWSNIAREYLLLLNAPILPPLVLTHLTHMTDEFGLFQFASLGTPNPDFGYTLDDNARAMIIGSWLNDNTLVNTYLNFMAACQKPDGTFINYIAFSNKSHSPQNYQEDLEESNARALWALGEVLSNSSLPTSTTNQATQMWLAALPRACSLTHPRAMALVIKAVYTALPKLEDARPDLSQTIDTLARGLSRKLAENSHTDWRWFEDRFKYNNAVLPESLLIAGHVLANDQYTKAGLQALEFLIGKTFEGRMYVPIGHTTWYGQGNTRSYFDQQPEDPAATILALATAYRTTGQQRYKELAFTCFSWFLGNNMVKKPLYNYETGSCYDGLHPDRVNLNQGAESLVSYLLSRIAIEWLLQK